MARGSRNIAVSPTVTLPLFPRRAPSRRKAGALIEQSQRTCSAKRCVPFD
jgi:hypothetical protein